MSRLDQRLLADHQRLEGLFADLLNAAEGADQPTLQQVWTEFESGLLAHLDAEEQYLLPHFEKTDPGVARTVRADHERIREAIAALGVSTDLHLLRLDVAEELIRTLREHAALETRSLYAWAERSVEEKDRAAILEALGGKAKRRADASD